MKSFFSPFFATLANVAMGICCVSVCWPEFVSAQLAGRPVTASTQTPKPTPTALPVKLELAVTVLPDGAHLDLAVTNLTLGTLAVDFPRSTRVKFLAVHNGAVVWDSLSGQQITQITSKLLLEGQETKTFSAFWPTHCNLRTGELRFQARFLTRVVVDATPIILSAVPKDATLTECWPAPGSRLVRP